MIFETLAAIGAISVTLVLMVLIIVIYDLLAGIQEGHRRKD